MLLPLGPKALEILVSLNVKIKDVLPVLNLSLNINLNHLKENIKCHKQNTIDLLS